MDRRAVLASLAAATLFPLPARGSVSVQSVLDEDEGWEHVGDHASGVSVYGKEVSSLGLTAYKGIYELDVDSEKLFGQICDLEGHMDVSDQLVESRIILTQGERSDFYQVMKSPAAFVSQRYWLNRSITKRDIGGVPGHHKRVWNALAMDQYPKVREALAETYPDAVLVETTHGSWEVSPTHLTYRTVSDPGGSVPGSVYSSLSSKTLPDNMLNFVRAVK